MTEGVGVNGGDQGGVRGDQWVKSLLGGVGGNLSGKGGVASATPVHKSHLYRYIGNCYMLYIVCVVSGAVGVNWGGDRG